LADQAASSAEQRDLSKEGSAILLEWVADCVTRI